MDGDRENLLQRIEDALVAGGYERAREPALSPFEKITGGLVWCIVANKVEVEYEYTDGLVLGDRILVAEAIESALQRMGCPLSLQAHQIQGLDYPAVHPVVLWLVKRLGNREEVTTKRPSFQRKEHQEDNTAESRRSDRETSLESTGKQSLDSQKLTERGSCGPAGEASFRTAGGVCDGKIKALQDEVQSYKEKLLWLKKDTATEKDNRSQSLSAELEKLKPAITDYESVDRVLTMLKTLKVLEKKKAALSDSCGQESLQKELDPSSKVSGDELEIEKNNKYLRKEVAEVSRTVVHLQRRLDDLPTQSELIQYERCFMELYVNIQAKLRETRKYFASYNALAEVNELSLKEVSLLNSINSQYETAMSTPQGRVKFVESMQGISSSVEQKLKKMEVRCAEKRSSYNALREKHGAALSTRRHYYGLIKQLQEELARSEKLQESHSRKDDM